MKKRNLLPTQTAPVARDKTTSSHQGQKGIEAANFAWGDHNPFAGDDAE